MNKKYKSFIFIIFHIYFYNKYTGGKARYLSMGLKYFKLLADHIQHCHNSSQILRFKPQHNIPKHISKMCYSHIGHHRNVVFNNTSRWIEFVVTVISRVRNRYIQEGFIFLNVQCFYSCFSLLEIKMAIIQNHNKHKNIMVFSAEYNGIYILSLSFVISAPTAKTSVKS